MQFLNCSNRNLQGEKEKGGGGLQIIIEMFRENCSNIFSLKDLQFVICTMQATPKLEIHNTLNCGP